MDILYTYIPVINMVSCSHCLCKICNWRETDGRVWFNSTSWNKL